VDVIAIAVDTNAYSDAKRGLPDAVAVLQAADVVGVPVVVLGEILGGLSAGSRARKNRDELERFIRSPRAQVLVADADTADRYAEIWRALRSRGRPIPTNDLWIAAIVVQHGFRLFTRDAHFREVVGLRVVTGAADLAI
jgi:predicted nucleic acid-binding protein